MKWKEVAVKTTHEAGELIADILSGLGSEGVSIYDSQDFLTLQNDGGLWDYADESLSKISDVVIVKGYFKDGGILSELSEQLDALKSGGYLMTGSLEVDIADIEDEDWYSNWKKYFQPIVIEGIVIVPEWMKYGGSGVQVLIDPGMAFGTGSHETTSMCLRLMQHIKVGKKSVADIGCGSGILGIAAVKCGAESAYLVDIDPVAIKAAGSNAALNEVSGKIKLKEGFFESGTVRSADIIFANITADPLIALSSVIYSSLTDGGHAILSGIIAGRFEQVLNAYLKEGFTVTEDLRAGDWHALLLRKEK